MAEIRKLLAAYPDVSFINSLSFEEFLTSMIADFQEKMKEETGKEISLATGDPRRLFLYTCGMYIYQGYQLVDRAGKRGLLKYSTGEYLDNLAALKNVLRAEAKAATTTLRFTLSKPQTGTIGIPEGTRVKAGELFFATEKYVEIPSGENDTEVRARCLTVGEVGNGYLPGELKILVDPINYVQSVVNVTETSGGSDKEDDEALAERVYLAPQGYSVAGPEGAYAYWIRTFSSEIQDCRIVSESPGEVDVYILLKGGRLPPEEFTEGLMEYLRDGNRRPLTDYVIVKSPETVGYRIRGTYYIGNDSREMAATIQKQVEAACQEYIEWQKAAIARDINPSRLIYQVMAAGAKWIDLREPAFRELEGATVADVESVELVYGGIQDD